MKLIGVTGGIGMGKSTSGEFLEKIGLAVVDTDALARRVVRPGMPALDEVVQTFGKDVLDADGSLNREALARIVFGDEPSRKKLEAILHPRIRTLWVAQADIWRTEKRAAAAVIIPLLFETEAQKQFDAVLCVACSRRTQHERLRNRKWSDAEIANRIASQIPIERKIEASDYVVWTEGSLSTHEAQLRRILGR
jgi:dephospho-CoA kinase